MKSLFRLIAGSYRVTLHSASPEKVLNYALKYNLPIWNIIRKENEISFSVLPRHRRHFRTLFQSLSEEESWRETEEGVRILFRRFGKRWGLLLGGGIFLMALFLSGTVVWSVEAEGNAQVPDAVICEKMERLGLKPGVRIKGVDASDFSLLFQVKNPEFSFVSLNIIGTRAILSVREREQVEIGQPASGDKVNLVASVSGTVLRYEVLAGQIAVTRGEVVPKGALLVSGIVERPNGTYRFLEAKGRVIAQTERFFQVSVPFSKVSKAYTGREESRKRYEILGFAFAPLHYENAPYESCDVIEYGERMQVLGRNLPIICKTRTYHETEEKNRALTVDSAKNLAYDKYEEYKRDTLLPGYRILEENVTLTQDEEALTLSVELVLEEDIATPLPFSYTESNEIERIINVRENH